MMVSALWSNSNYDGDGKGESPRQEALDDIEARCDEAIMMIRTGKKPDEEDAIDESNPFYQAMRRGQAKLDVPVESGSGKSVAAVEAETDQG